MRSRPSSWAAWGLFALFLGLSASVGYLESRGAAPDAGESVTETVSLLVAFTAFAVVGALIASRQPRNIIGWLLLAIGLGTVSTGFAGAYAELSLSRPVPLPGTVWVAWYQSWSWLPSVALAFIFLPLLFPTGRLPSPRWRPVAVVGAALSAAFAAVGAFSPTIDIGSDRPSGTPQIANPLGIEAVQRLEHGMAEAVFELTSLAVILLVLASVVVRYRRSPQDQREQLKWFVFAVILNAVGAVGGELLPPPLNSNVVFAVIVSLLPVSVGIAVLKYRLYDIDVVINKTLVYGALAVFITAVYVGVVVGIGTAIGTRGEPNLGLQIAATALVAVAFQPVRARVQRLANRVVYGRRATPYEVLSAFSGQVAGIYDMDHVLSRMARTVAEGMGATKAGVWLRVGAELRPAASWPPTEDGGSPVPLPDGDFRALPGADRAYPVHHQGELLGALAVAKGPGDPLRPQEDGLLGDLASQAGLVLRNVRLTIDLQARLEELHRQAAELRASRRRIVATQDAERRRLERNIHDGAQQHLVALAVRMRLARTLAEKNPDKARPLLEDIRAHLQETADSLRDLARGLYPPVLTERGVAPALEAQAERAPLPVAVQAEGVGRYSREVEAAVYFAALEALQNAGKYAEAGVTVRLAEESGTLVFTVADDGRGFDPATTPRGSGLTNVGDRLRTVGGTVQIDSAPGRGTTVAGRVPLRPVEGAT